MYALKKASLINRTAVELFENLFGERFWQKIRRRVSLILSHTCTSFSDDDDDKADKQFEIAAFVLKGRD